MALLQRNGSLTYHHWTTASPCCKEALLGSQWRTLRLVTRQWHLQGKTPGKGRSSYRNTIGQSSPGIRIPANPYTHMHFVMSIS